MFDEAPPTFQNRQVLPEESESTKQPFESTSGHYLRYV